MVDIPFARTACPVCCVGGRSEAWVDGRSVARVDKGGGGGLGRVVGGTVCLLIFLA